MTKYQRGDSVYSLSVLVTLLDAGQWVYYHTRPKHPSIIYNMTLQTIMQGLTAGAFATAILRKKEVDQ